jgi:hypothetical protein
LILFLNDGARGGIAIRATKGVWPVPQCSDRRADQLPNYDGVKNDSIVP